MKRLLAAVLCLVLVCAAAARAAEPEQALWTRSEGDGDYVTIRVPCPEGEQLSWAQTRKLCVRYADTGEPVALCSNYYRGYLFATVPAAQAGRTLEPVWASLYGLPTISRYGKVWNTTTLRLAPMS